MQVVVVVVQVVHLAMQATAALVVVALAEVMDLTEYQGLRQLDLMVHLIPAVVGVARVRTPQVQQQVVLVQSYSDT
jgi:hypothetical protein